MGLSLTMHEDLDALLARMALGDRAALSGLYAATSAKLFGVVLRVVTDRPEAEDALQEVYVKVWLNAWRFRANGLSPMSWLMAIAHNHAIDLLRKRQGRHTVSMNAVADRADPSRSPEDAAIAASLQRRIAACLAELKPDHADAVLGAYLYDVPYRDLAARYDVPLNTLRTHLRRSLLKLRASLKTCCE